MKNNINTRGFTLIELLVVIAIIGMLASIVLVSLNSARNRGRDARIASDVQQIRTHAESSFNGINYGVALTGVNTATTPGAGIVTTAGTVGAQLTTDASNQGSRLFAITNANPPTAYAIFGALTSQAANTYFCIDSAGRTNQAVTTTTPTIACQ